MLCIYIAITCFLVRRERLKLYDALLKVGIDAIQTNPIVLNSTFALSGLERGGLGSAAKPVRPSGQAGRRCAPVAGVEFLRIGRLEWT